MARYQLADLQAKQSCALGAMLVVMFETSFCDGDGKLAARETIAAIAARWAFADTSHLSRTFKCAFGVSPRDYRAAVMRPEDLPVA